MDGTSFAGRWRLAGLALVCGGLVAGVLPGNAQTTSLPGLVITPTTPAGQQPPKDTKPAVRAKKAAPQREANAAEPDKSTRGSGQGIVALVNDEPVTGYEVQQRA